MSISNQARFPSADPPSLDGSTVALVGCPIAERVTAVTDGNSPVSGLGLGREQLAELYEANWSSLVRTGAWLLGDSALAEEVVQDAFIRLVEHWHQLNDPLAAPAWLRRTVVNLSRSRMRRFAVGRQKTRLAAAREQVADFSAQRLGEDLSDGELGAAIRRLPRRQRECVVLRFVHDLAVAEIASTLGIGAGSVKTHLHRGLHSLGNELEDPARGDAQIDGGVQ